jgi:hypothetical protein
MRGAINAARLIVLAALLSGCSARWHLNQAVTKNPGLIEAREVVMIDTLIIREPQIAADTIVLNQIDTVLIESPAGVKTKIIRRVDTFEINTICPGDTIRVREQIIVPGPIRYEPRRGWPWWAWIGLGAILTLVIFGRR